MKKTTRHIVGAVAYSALGAAICLAGLALISIWGGGTTLLREINDHYAAVLGTSFSLILILITAVYVVLTYFQAQATQQSVRLNREFLAHAEKQLLHSRVPMLMADMDKSKGGPYFGERRRQLGVDWKIKNIGDGPALQIHVRMKLKYTHAEFEDYDETCEQSFVGNLAPKDDTTAHMWFETAKIEKMQEDFSIKSAKNIARVKLNPRQSAYRGPELHLTILYSNVHGQFFKTVVVYPILCLRVASREDEEEKMVHWFAEKPLQDEEDFELVLMNPIFSRFSFDPVDRKEGEAEIEHYRALL